MGSRGCRHMHLAYVPLMSREASTCMHADNVVYNAVTHSNCLAVLQNLLVISAMLTPNTEEKSMWCDSPSCSVESSPGPTDCSERFCVAAWAMSKLCEGQVLIPGRSEAYKHDITESRINIRHAYSSRSQSFLSAPNDCVQSSLHTAAHALPSIDIESRNCSSPLRCLNDGSKP